MRAKTAIIVVNYKTPWHLRECLTSVFAHTSDFHLYLVQNSQDSESISVSKDFKSQYPNQITIFQNDSNLGFVGGVNTPYAEAVQHQYICVLNSDVIVTQNWLGSMVGVLDTDSDIAQVGPDCNHYYPERSPWTSIKQLVRLSPELGYRLSKWRMNFNPPSNETKSDFIEFSQFYNFLGGFCYVFPTRLLNERGYILDPNIAHGYWDDTDLSFYLRQYGKIGMCTNSYVYHFLNVSFNKLSDPRSKLKNRLKRLNAYYVTQKWSNYIKTEIAKLSAKELLVAVRDYADVREMLEALSALQLNPQLVEYLSQRPAVEVASQLLNPK